MESNPDEIKQYDEVEYIIHALSTKIYAISFLVIAIIGLFFAFNQAMQVGATWYQFVYSTFFATMSCISMVIAYVFKEKYDNLVYMYETKIKVNE